MGSFDPRFHVKDNTVKLAEDLGSEAVRYQGNWIPHKLRPATEDGDLLRRRLRRPLPAADRRGHPHRAVLRAGLRPRAAGRAGGRAEPSEALRRYGAFSDSHEWKFRWMLRAQRIVPRIWPPLLNRVVSAMTRNRLVDWAFGHYLRIAPPEFAGQVPQARAGRRAREHAAA